MDACVQSYLVCCITVHTLVVEKEHCDLDVARHDSGQEGLAPGEPPHAQACARS